MSPATRAEFRPPSPPPEAEVHLIMSRCSAERLLDILRRVHTGEFYQALVGLLSPPSSPLDARDQDVR